MQVRPFLRGIRLDRGQVPDFEVYPFCIPAVRALGELTFHEEVTFFVGENGTGKSTLLEAIAAVCGFCPEGGGRNFQVETRATHSPLWRYLIPLAGPLVPAGRILPAGGELLQRGHRHRRAGSDSRPRARLSETRMAEARTRVLMGRAFSICCTTVWAGTGLYLFDEPEAALSPARQLAALAEMRRLTHAGSQLILSTHSPILLAYPHSRIYQLGEDGIRPIAYEDAEAVRVTRAFLSRPEQTVRQLLQAEENPPPSGE